MDESILSNPEVIEASRSFICIRLLTYENAEEGEFVKGLFRTRSGQLENTVFVLLAPDGKTKLSAAGRSPGMVFPGPESQTVGSLVAEMKRVARAHPGANGKSQPASIPYHHDVRRALNTAACDLQPVAVVVAKNDRERRGIEKNLLSLAWSAPLMGQFAFATADDVAGLAMIDDAVEGQRFFVIRPDSFGLKGKVLASTDRVDSKSLQRALIAGLDKFDGKSKNVERLIREAHRQGLKWESEIPSTDPDSRRGREPPRR